MWYIKIFGRHTVGVLTRSNYKLPPAYTNIILFNFNHPLYNRACSIDSCVSLTWKDVLLHYVHNEMYIYIYNGSQCTRVSVGLWFDDDYICFFS